MEDLEILKAKELEAEAREQRQNSFGMFVRHVSPDTIIGRHHKLMAEKFDQIANGTLKRLMIFMPPGHTKSMFGSILFPQWYIGKYPKKRILHISHTAELVQGFGRDVRDGLATQEYKETFPGVDLRSDSKAAGRWHTTKGGIYTAAGVGGAIAGKRGEIGIIDDPVSEQDAYSASARKRFAEWYPGGFRSRLMPGAPIIWIQTRWTHDDPAGWMLETAAKSKSKEKWDVIELPAILDEKAAKTLGQGAKAGEALFPELWPLEELIDIRDSGMPPSQWESLYLQQPKPQEGGIIKRYWWKQWDGPMPTPKAYFASWDTAFSEADVRNSAYSACTWWMVFYSEHTQKDALMLMGRWYSKAGYPELREKALSLDKELGVTLTHLVERRASGHSLIQDLRKSRRWIRVIGYDPKMDGDKVARAYLASPMFKSGLVYRPNRKWAVDLIDMVASFPLGPPLTRDLTDTVTQAVQYLNRGWYLRHPDDELDNDLDDDVQQTMNTYEHGVYG